MPEQPVRREQLVHREAQELKVLLARTVRQGQQDLRDKLVVHY